MTANIYTNYPNDFPGELIAKSKPLAETLGVNDIAWEYPLVITVIKELEKANALILGGDVLTNKIEYTGDNWSFSEEELKHSPHDCYAKTIDYIENYVKKNSNIFYFVLVF